MWLTLHHLTVCLVFAVSIDQLRLGDYVSFTNIGIRLCQYKCVQYGCQSIRYNIETLTCHLSDMDSEHLMKETGHFVGLLQLSNVKAGICTLNTCRGMRCLETHAGKPVCVKDGHYQKYSRAFANTTLIDACSLGDLNQVKYILSHDTANINSRGQSDRTPAMIAAGAGHRAVLELLVEKGANLSLLDVEDNNILHFACMEGNLEIVKYIHSQKIVDIDSRGGNGTTPLMLAALFGKMEVCVFLVKIGADISKEDDDGENILHVSCQGGNVEIVKYVLARTVLYINSTDNNGITPLMLAAGYEKKDVFHFLIEIGADTLAKDDAERTTLHWACQGGNVMIVNNILTQNIVDINSNDRKKVTPLLLAAYCGNRDVLRLLIEKGANTLAVDDKSRNILHLSCTGGHVDTVKYVLNHTSMDINSKDYVEMTPVMLAAYRGNREVFDILVNKGADLSIVDEDGDNILHWACRGGNVEMVNHILIQNLVDINSKGDAGMTPVLIAAYLAKREVFNCLVKHGADLSVVGEDGDNILHSACCGGNVEIVNDILAKNFVNINTKGYKGRSPMLHSLYHRKREVFDFLVKQGADLSVVDEDGDNILHLACGRGNMKMVKYILTQTTVDINSRNNKKMTPLLVAAYHGKRDVLALLIATGAHVLAVDHKGRNMLHIPCTRGDVDTVKYVLNLNSVDINSKDLKGMTPVLNAAYWGESELFDIFSKRGADLSVTDKDGNNILHIACMGDTELVKHVVKLHVVDINCRGCNGMTPLLYCAQYCERDVFELLLESGADPLVVNTDGDNVLHLACEKGSEDIVESLLSQNIVNLTTKNKEGLNASEIARGNGFLSLAKLLSQAYQSLR